MGRTNGLTLEKRIINMLERRLDLREDDRKLILAIWEEMGLKLSAEQQDKMFSTYSPESIRRTRQRLNERGICLPDANTQKRRKALANQTRQIVREEKKPMVQASFINQGANPWLNS